jgi:hypothetical protein
MDRAERATPAGRVAWFQTVSDAFTFLHDLVRAPSP